MKNAILFDYGGVLGYDHLIENEERLSKRLGLTREELNNRTSEKSMVGRLYRENRLSEEQFWKCVAPSVEIDKVMAATFTLMWMDTYKLNTEMLLYLQTLRANAKVGILTNIDESRSQLLEEIVGAERNLDFYFPSYRFGFSKDDERLWRHIAEELKAFEVTYIDDRAEHVRSAQVVGWNGIQYTNLEILKKQIGLILG